MSATARVRTNERAIRRGYAPRRRSEAPLGVSRRTTGSPSRGRARRRRADHAPPRLAAALVRVARAGAAAVRPLPAADARPARARLDRGDRGGLREGEPRARPD